MNEEHKKKVIRFVTLFCISFGLASLVLKLASCGGTPVCLNTGNPNVENECAPISESCKVAVISCFHRANTFDTMKLCAETQDCGLFDRELPENCEQAYSFCYEFVRSSRDVEVCETMLVACLNPDLDDGGGIHQGSVSISISVSSLGGIGGGDSVETDNSSVGNTSVEESSTTIESSSGGSSSVADTTEDETSFDDSTATSVDETSSSTTTHSHCWDADYDGVCDAADNCPYTWNPEQVDRDGDGAGASCDRCDLRVGPKHGWCEFGKRKEGQHCWRNRHTPTVKRWGPNKCEKRCREGLVCAVDLKHPGSKGGHCVHRPD